MDSLKGFSTRRCGGWKVSMASTKVGPPLYQLISELVVTKFSPVSPKKKDKLLKNPKFWKPKNPLWIRFLNVGIINLDKWHCQVLLSLELNTRPLFHISDQNYSAKTVHDWIVQSCTLFISKCLLFPKNC